MKNKFILLFLILVSAFICNFLWLYEIVKVKDWSGLNWLEGYMYSVYVIIPVIVFTYLIPFKCRNQLSVSSFIKAFVILSITSLISYEGARILIFTISSRFFWLDSDLLSWMILIVAVLVILSIFSLSYYFVTARYFHRLKKRVIFIYPAIVFLGITLGIITVKIFPGYGTESGFVDAVKMGYPIFWLDFFLGLTSVVLSRKSTSSLS